MNDLQRRKFLSFSFAVTSIAAGCGGGKNDAASTATTGTVVAAPPPPVAPVAPVAPVSPAPTPVPAPPSSGARQFSLSAASTSTAPFSIGYVFRQGDIPAGSNVATSIPNTQAFVQNRWPDGSVKFALISGRASLTSGTPLTVSLSATTTAPTGTALTTTDLRNTGITAAVDCGTYGAASFSATDWVTPFKTWVSGPEMSAWIFRKQVGTDAHLVIWLEVRLYAGGAVDVVPWMENGYLKVPGVGSRNTTYTFTLGGTQRFSQAIALSHHRRAPLLSGTALSHWLDTDPNVAMHHDTDYLQSTELVPTYLAAVPPTARPVRVASTTFTPLLKGNFEYDGDDMSSGGYAAPIGLLPEHDVLYFTSNTGVEFGSVVRNGFSAGRYGIHYRDETTNRPFRFSSYPHLVVGDHSSINYSGASTTGDYTPVSGNGGFYPIWDLSHSPSVGFLAYLLTGRYFFMEEAQFAATANYLGITDWVRNFSDCLFLDGEQQTRAIGWGMRTLCHALTVTPDNDTDLRNEFIHSIQINIAHFHAKYVAQPNCPMGFIKPYINYNYNGGSGNFFSANWMEDFVTAAFGYALAMRLPLDATTSTQLAAFFQWKAKSIVGRLGPSTGFWYINAAPYVTSFAPGESPDFDGGTGPWHASWAAAYAATYASPPEWMGHTEGVLAGEYMPAGSSYWGNLHPAIAYAVRHGVPGALDAYHRMTSATNYPEVVEDFKTYPVWSVKPASL